MVQLRSWGMTPVLELEPCASGRWSIVQPHHDVSRGTWARQSLPERDVGRQRFRPEGTLSEIAPRDSQNYPPPCREGSGIGRRLVSTSRPPSSPIADRSIPPVSPRGGGAVLDAWPVSRETPDPRPRLLLGAGTTVPGCPGRSLNTWLRGEEPLLGSAALAAFVPADLGSQPSVLDDGVNSDNPPVSRSCALCIRPAQRSRLGSGCSHPGGSPRTLPIGERTRVSRETPLVVLNRNRGARCGDPRPETHGRSRTSVGYPPLSSQALLPFPIRPRHQATGRRSVVLAPRWSCSHRKRADSRETADSPVIELRHLSAPEDVPVDRWGPAITDRARGLCTRCLQTRAARWPARPFSRPVAPTFRVTAVLDPIPRHRTGPPRGHHPDLLTLSSAGEVPQ
ncbi:hypothetical protein J2S58_002377 [Nakamurella flavida]|nr:hypothetical protein [Nakamurella flavida]